MQEFIAVIISFFTIPFLTKKKVSIGIAISACAVILSVLSGLGLNVLFNVVFQTLTDVNRIKQYIVIIEIGILGVLLKEYNFIDKIIDSLTKVVNNQRIILMFVPVLVGLLGVPGGAIISAPFIDKIGEDAKIPKTHRAIINLIFRHVSYHIMPFSNGMLITALLVPQISIYSVIGLNFIFITIYSIIGYFLYIRKIEVIKTESLEPMLPNLIKLLKYTAPIYIAVILNILFKIPLYIGLLVNFLSIYMLNPTRGFFKDIADAFNTKILLSIIGVYLIQGVMGRMEYLNLWLVQIFSNSHTTMLGIIITSLFFGLATGFQPAALGVILPILSVLPISNNRLLLYTHFTFIWSFMGYFFSPLHLCQLFTCEYLGVKTSELYKNYSKFIIALVGALVLMYFVLTSFIK